MFYSVCLHRTYTRTMTQEQETIFKLIRREFDSLKFFWQEEDRKELIKATRFIGLNEQANLMQTEL